MGKPFHPPPRNFTSLMNYNGSALYNGEEYIKFPMFIPESGGPFEYTFWNKPQEKDGEIYYEPSFFYMLGVHDDLPNWMDQHFFNFKNEVPDNSAFDIPLECRADDLPYCPNFGPSTTASKRFSNFMQ